jgi:hypothetical protein
MGGDLPERRAGSGARRQAGLLRGRVAQLHRRERGRLDRGVRVRCDFLMLMFKRKLTAFVSSLPTRKLRELDRALIIALGVEVAQ